MLNMDSETLKRLVITRIREWDVEKGGVGLTDYGRRDPSYGYVEELIQKSPEFGLDHG